MIPKEYSGKLSCMAMAGAYFLTRSYTWTGPEPTYVAQSLYSKKEVQLTVCLKTQMSASYVAQIRTQTANACLFKYMQSRRHV